MALFQQGNFELHSGEQSTWKIDCDALTDEDLGTLARIISDYLALSAQYSEFGKVVGIPRGGLRLAQALEAYITPGCPLTLIVDDVLTTGQSMEAVRMFIGREECLGVVLFARNPCPPWVRAVFKFAL